jgi:PPP family 3-phenylpropionic acid transporter
LYASIYFMIGAYSHYFVIWLREAGWGEAEIGWQGGILATCRIVFPLWWGRLVDHTDAPVRALRLMTAGSVAAFLPFCVTAAFWPVMLASFLLGVFRVATIPVVDAVALSHVETAGGDYGRIRVWGSWGFIVGGFTMGWIVDLTVIDSVPWLLTASIAVNLLVLFWMRDTPGPPRESRPVLSTAWKLLTSPRYRGFYLVAFLSRLASSGIYIFLPIHLQDLGVRDSWIPVFWTTGVLSEIVLMQFARQIFGRFRRGRVLTFSFLCSVLQFGLTAIIREPWWLLPVMTLHGVTFGVWYYTTVSWLGDHAPREERHSAQAVFTSFAFGVAGTLSSLGSGYLYELGQGALMFGVAAAVSAITWVTSAAVFAKHDVPGG